MLDVRCSRLVRGRWPFLFHTEIFADAHFLFLAEIAESAERLSPDGEKSGHTVKHGKHRNGGLRPCAASQLVCLAESAKSAEILIR